MPILIMVGGVPVAVSCVPIAIAAWAVSNDVVIFVYSVQHCRGHDTKLRMCHHRMSVCFNLTTREALWLSGMMTETLTGPPLHTCRAVVGFLCHTKQLVHMLLHFPALWWRNLRWLKWQIYWHSSRTWTLHLQWQHRLRSLSSYWIVG